jgi:hypothetical protein
MIEPEKIIDEWKRRIELAKEYKHSRSADICLSGTITSIFDNLHIHAMELDALAVKWTDNITVIPSDRAKRLESKHL